MKTDHFWRQQFYDGMQPKTSNRKGSCFLLLRKVELKTHVSSGQGVEVFVVAK